MDGFSIYDVGIAGATLVVIVIFMLVGFVKGMVRMFFGLISLAIGGMAAYWGFKHGDGVAGYMIADPEPWMAAAVGAILGLAVFFTARAIFGMVARPTKVIDGKKRNSPGFGGLLGIVGGLVFVAFLISGVRYLGTIAELDWLKKSLADEGKINKLAQPLLVSLRNSIDGTTAGGIHREYDILNDRNRAQLAKLKILTEENVYATTRAAADANVMKAFNQPEVRKILQSTPELKAYIQENKFSHLLANKKIQETSAIPAAQEVLAPIDLIKVLGLEPKKKPKKKDDSKAKK